MKYFILILTLQTFLFANIFNDINIFKAQVAYKNKNYSQSLELYKKVKNKNDDILYNIGNILYRQAKYKEAISYYKKINSSKLIAKKLYNIGNCYIGLKDTKSAIAFYKSALKFDQTKNTVNITYNLNLALELQQKIIQELEKQKKKNRLLNTYEQKIDDIDKDTVSQNMVNAITTNIKRKNNFSTNKSAKLQDEIAIAKFEDKNITKKVIDTKPSFTKLEEKRINKQLGNRALNTLLIPLENKGMNDDKYPW